MLYPVYVHIGDADHAHGVTFPDFPGCFSAALTIGATYPLPFKKR